MVALRLTASEKETRDVAAEKVENQKLLGLSFQEKGMLDMALATFNKLPLTDDMKLVYVNLGLDYENRGQRDKAFLVYKKVFDVDPALRGRGPAHGAPQPGAAPGSSLFAVADRRRRHGTRRPDSGAADGRRSPRAAPAGHGADPSSPAMAPTELAPTAVRRTGARRSTTTPQARPPARGSPRAPRRHAPCRRPS